MYLKRILMLENIHERDFSLLKLLSNEFYVRSEPVSELLRISQVSRYNSELETTIIALEAASR